MVDEQLPVAPKTTAQEDITTAGQRKINLIWEWTQAIISVLIVLANIVVSVYQGVSTVQLKSPEILSNSLFLVVGFYFSRTNHAAIGGIGSKPMQNYEGR